MPDKTLIKLNSGPGYIDYLEELINVYFDSSLLNRIEMEYDLGQHTALLETQINNPKAMQGKINKKGINFKIIDTI